MEHTWLLILYSILAATHFCAWYLEKKSCLSWKHETLPNGRYLARWSANLIVSVFHHHKYWIPVPFIARACHFKCTTFVFADEINSAGWLVGTDNLLHGECTCYLFSIFLAPTTGTHSATSPITFRGECVWAGTFPSTRSFANIYSVRARRCLRPNACHMPTWYIGERDWITLWPPSNVITLSDLDADTLVNVFFWFYLFVLSYQAEEMPSRWQWGWAKMGEAQNPIKVGWASAIATSLKYNLDGWNAWPFFIPSLASAERKIISLCYRAGSKTNTDL